MSYTEKKYKYNQTIYRLLITFIVILGISLRLQNLIYSDGEWKFDEYYYYYTTAKNCYNGVGFIPEYTLQGRGIFVPPPMQSWFILGVFRLCGSVVNPIVPKLFQVVISGAMIFLTFQIVMTLKSPVSGVAASLLVAIYPDFIYWTDYLMTESNFLFGLALLLYLIQRWLGKPTFINAILTAMCLGVLNLQRPNGIFIGPLLAMFFLAISACEKKNISQSIILVVIPICILYPWRLRNIAIFNEPIWVSSHGGLALHMGNRLNLDPMRTKYFDDILTNYESWIVPEIEKEIRGSNGEKEFTYYAYSKAYLQCAKSYITEHPLHFLKNYIIKFINQFYLIQFEAVKSVSVFKRVLLYTLFHWSILIGGVIGLFLVWRNHRNQASLSMMAIFCYFALFGALFNLTKDGRMTLVLKFFLIIFSSVLIDYIYRAVVLRNAQLGHLDSTNGRASVLALIRPRPERFRLLI